MRTDYRSPSQFVFGDHPFNSYESRKIKDGEEDLQVRVLWLERHFSLLMRYLDNNAYRWNQSGSSSVE